MANHGSLCYMRRTFPGSSVVEQLTVNQLVAGSNPARGANIPSQNPRKLPNYCSVTLLRLHRGYDLGYGNYSFGGYFVEDENRYLVLKSGRRTWMYRRYVPKDCKDSDARFPVIQKSTGERAIEKARVKRDSFEAADNQYWSALRLGADAETARERYEASLAINEALRLDKPPEEMTVGELMRRNRVAFEIIGEPQQYETAVVPVMKVDPETDQVYEVEEEQEVPVFDSTVHDALLGVHKNPRIMFERLLSGGWKILEIEKSGISHLTSLDVGEILDCMQLKFTRT